MSLNSVLDTFKQNCYVLFSHTVTQSIWASSFSASCPELTLANGDVSQTNTEGGTASYTCHSDYSLVDGDSPRTCQADGNWDGTEPQCIGWLSGYKYVHIYFTYNYI